MLAFYVLFSYLMLYYYDDYYNRTQTEYFQLKVPQTEVFKDLTGTHPVHLHSFPSVHGHCFAVEQGPDPSPDTERPRQPES